MKKAILGMILGTLTLLTTACGGGGGSSTSNVTNTLTGKFLDSAVSGLNYNCSSGNSGTTNGLGEYTCNVGDSVSFSIAGITLATVGVADNITPMTLFPNNEEAAINLTQLLQTLDVNDNPNDGIVLDTALVNILNGNAVDFSANDFDATMAVLLGKALVNEQSAITHLNTTLSALGMTTIALNNAPTITDNNITIVVSEGESKDLNVSTCFSDIDGDILTYVAQYNGNSTLPTGYSFNSPILTIDVAFDSLADGVNEDYNITIIGSDSEANVSLNVVSTIQDSANDSILTATDIVASTTVNNGTNSNISLVVTDADGVDSVSFEVKDNSDVIVLSGALNDVNSDNNYSTTVATDSLNDGNYTITVIATGIDGGEGFYSTVTKTHDFTVATPTSQPTISMDDTEINDNGGFEATTLSVPTTTNVEAGATYEIVDDPTSGMLTIDPDTGTMTWNGDVDNNTIYDITIKVTNSDTGNGSGTFILTVITNG